ncbi:hypothetical protein CC1G_02599 [Coprinopsis cinerea okayama7|uniref:Phytocyanin domain-containing protein n=1 Tax=Coprinopsis cinerea (strain Okayama-7 / 130 / ATCC MYA-4618 / FGSC 9003) TaxID=240176 RepID=A8PBA6_COPC7|nr:hypothetical protein CC1G_02599 [Coprinopsis cinerea okayama7\|eukprot:XP_001840136.2 hypothetical protein CC1G_02599 [Coprinopsis cinerea okayama7\
MYPAAVALAVAAIVPSAVAVTYDVQVGPGGQFIYDPPYVHAEYGDIINFVFVPVAPEAIGTETRQFHVPDNHGEPIWFYCGQGNHCGQGMVFAVNPPAAPSERSFEAFQALAIERNGTGTPPTETSAPGGQETWTPPPPQPWYPATATVTWGGSSYTTVYTSYEGSPDPTPAPQPVEHTIQVGADNGLIYLPASISARVGDTVTFEFRSKNHTVTQSSFSSPCEALIREDGTTGFRSGFRPVPSGTTDFPRFSVRINDTAPIWGYCGQTGHCAQGMVFAINAVETGPNNFEAFQQLARLSASDSAGASSAPQPSGGAGGDDDDSEGSGAGGIAPATTVFSVIAAICGVAMVL